MPQCPRCWDGCWDQWGAGCWDQQGAGYLGAVEVAAVRAREPARPAGALVDAHVPQLDVHPHDAPVQGDGVSPRTLGRRSCRGAGRWGHRPGGHTRGAGRPPLELGLGDSGLGHGQLRGPGSSTVRGRANTHEHWCAHTHEHTNAHARAHACTHTPPDVHTRRQTRLHPGAAGTRRREESCPAPHPAPHTLHPAPHTLLHTTGAPHLGAMPPAPITSTGHPPAPCTPSGPLHPVTAGTTHLNSGLRSGLSP